MADEKKSPIREIIQPFIDFAKVPKVLWGVNISYMIEGMVYFGMLTFLAIYFNDYVGLNDKIAGWIVGAFTGGITLSMLFLGSVSDKIGIRKALLLAMISMFVGRLIFTSGPFVFKWGAGITSPLFFASLIGLLFVVIGYGMYQPSAYSAVKEFTDEKTSAMGYAVLYAVMNLGGFLPAIVSPPIRHWYKNLIVNKLKSAGVKINPDFHYGIPGVFWFYVVCTFIGIIVLLIFVNKKTIARALEEKRKKDIEKGKTLEEIKKEEESKKPRKETFKEYMKKYPFRNKILAFFTFMLKRIKKYFQEHPLRDKRFAFFIFILIPVQTLFAHNWLTLPQYVDRALGPIGKSYLETFVNLNPILIFVLTPLVAAITAKKDILKMMIAGTFVMSLPTFLLALGPYIPTFLAYIIIMSIGEAMWQPRFLQYAAELAPPGRTGEYMGVAQFPWFLTKIVTSIYSGWFLMKFCPEKGPRHTKEMWFIYGLIAVSSPIFLLLAKNWLKKGMKVKHEE